MYNTEQNYLSYSEMSEDFFFVFCGFLKSINNYHFRSNPIMQPVGTFQRYLMSLMKDNVNSEAHCPPYVHCSSTFHFPVTIWLMCIQETSKVQPKRLRLRMVLFYAFDVQSKSAWTHQRLVMTEAGQILEWSKHSKSLTFAKKLMIPLQRF